MRGVVNRPSLRPDTFAQHDQHSRSSNGLRAAFESRLLDEQQNNADHFPSKTPSDYHRFSNKDDAKPTNGLRAAFEKRPFDAQRKSDSQQSLEPKKLQNYPTREEPQPGPSGLRKAFLDRHQATPANMNSDQNQSDNASNSSSTLSERNQELYKNECDSVRYESIEESTGPYVTAADDQENLSDHYRTSGYHSIHRLSQLGNTQGGGNLRRAFEARTGGTTRRNLGKNNDLLLEKHANVIVAKMEQDQALMEDSLDAEELRRTTLRDMPQCLTIKRCVKVKLSRSVSRKSKKKSLSCWKMFKYRWSMSFLKLKQNIKDMAYSFELWYGPLKKIEGNFGTGVASFFKFLRWLFLVNFAIGFISFSFIVIPKLIRYTANDHSVGFKASDIVTGEGYFTNTLLFYGFYTNETIGNNLTYYMPYAYFFTMLSIYFVSFAVLGISAAKSYRRSFIETEGGLKNVFANKIFCGWDYNIATREAANLKTKAIFNELKELLSDISNKRQKNTFYKNFLIISVQLFMNLVVLCLIFATAGALWYFLNNVPADRDQRLIVAPIFVNTVMTLMPMFLSFIVKYEEYKNPKIALYLTLGRTFVLGAVTITVLVTYWLQNDSESLCWETALAQEFYRMIIFDFFISVVCASLLDVALFFFYKYFRKNTSLEFDIAWNTMQIIYNQTLLWVGLVFSPLLPVVVGIKLFLTWYIRYLIVMYLCKPAAKSWKAAQTTTWFLVMTFLSLMCIGGLIGYIISYIHTSKDCGPFRNYEHIYDIVTAILQLQSNSTVWAVVLFVTKPGVIAVIILFLCAKVYYSRAQANAQKEIVEQCRNMLKWSAKDKEYYYSLLSQATGGKWQYEFQDKIVNPQLFSPGSSANHGASNSRSSMDSTFPTSRGAAYGPYDASSSNHFPDKKYF